MKQKLLNKKVSITILLIQCVLFSSASNVYYSDIDTNRIQGVIYYSHKFIKRFSVLMRDTSLSGNHFNLGFHLASQKKYDGVVENFQLRPFLINSEISDKCDSILYFDKERVHVYSYSKKKSSKAILSIDKYIRLYIGYIDADNILNVVVQLVTLKEFEDMKSILSNQLFLVGGQKILRYTVIRFSPGNY